MEGEKLKNSNFQMKRDLEAYLEWEIKVDQIFACHKYSEEKKIRLATLGFDDKILTWWKLEKNARGKIRKPDSNMERNEDVYEEDTFTTFL